MKVYNYARTPAQIAWDYNQGAPVAQYNFDECSGTVAHDTAPKSDPRNFTAYNGTINASTSGQLSAGSCSVNANTMWYNGRSGKYSSSLNFDGTDDYIQASPDLNVQGWTGLTVSAWINKSIVQNSEIVSKGTIEDHGYGSTSFWLRSAADTIEFNVGTTGTFCGGNWNSLFTGDLSLNNQWFHVVGTWDGNTASIYINGKLSVSNYIAGSGCYMNNWETLTIGREAKRAIDYFQGQMDDIRIYNYALTQSQVQTLYNQGSAVKF
jgi:hypothetical protein